MFKTNFYTGEMSTEQYTTEAEATLNAGFGQYAPSGYVPPTTYGLGGNAYQQQYPQQQYYYQNPYMNAPEPEISYSGQRWGNPVLQQGYGYQQFYQQPQQQNQYSQIYIPPVNISGNDYLFPANMEEIAQDMIIRYYHEEAEAEGKRIADRAKAKREGRYNPYNYNGYNYYGNPLFGNSYQQSFHSKVVDEINQIKDKARQDRLNLSKRLSRLAHNAIGDNMTDEEIDCIYSGRYVNVENTVYACTEQDRFQDRFTNNDRFYPIDPTETQYKDFVVKTKQQIQSILPQDTTIEEFGSRINILLSEWELEELKSKRRAFDQSYDSSAYKRLLKEKCAEKAANQYGFSLIRSEEPVQVTQIKEKMEDQPLTPAEKTKIMKNSLAQLGLPLMSDAVYFDEEGNMCLRANVGNHIGQTYTVSNENEAAYANKRALFAGFLDSIPRSEELHDEKIDQYNRYSESEFQYNMTHPPSTNIGGG